MNGSLLGTTLRVRAQRLAVCGITLLAVAQARVATILAAEYPRLSSTSVALLPDKELPRPSSPSAAPFTFSNTGSLTTGRQLHTATLLTNGKVLVAAGASAFSVVS